MFAIQRDRFEDIFAKGSLQDLSLNVILRNITRHNPQSMARLPQDIVKLYGSRLSPLMLLIHDNELNKRGVETNSMWCDALSKRRSYRCSKLYKTAFCDDGEIPNAKEVYIHSHFQDLITEAIEFRLYHGRPSSMQMRLVDEYLDRKELNLCARLTMSHFVPYVTRLVINARDVQLLSDLALNQLALYLKTIKVCYITNESFLSTIRFFAFFVRYGKQEEVCIKHYKLKGDYCKLLMEVLSGNKTVDCPSFNQQYIDVIPTIQDLTVCGAIKNCSSSFIRTKNCSEELKQQFGTYCTCDEFDGYMSAPDLEQTTKKYFEDPLFNLEKEIHVQLSDSSHMARSNAINENCPEEITAIEHASFTGSPTIVIKYPITSTEECMCVLRNRMGCKKKTYIPLPQNPRHEEMFHQIQIPDMNWLFL